MRRKSPGSACSLETLEPRLLLSYDFGLSHTGPLNVVRGHDTYIIVRATSASATAEDVWNSVSLPTGVTATWMGNSYFYQLSSASPGALLLKLSVAPNMPLGPADVTVSGSSGSTHVVHSDMIDIVVNDVPSDPTPEFNTVPLPIDSTVLAAWESRMTTAGATYGSSTYINAHPPGDETGTWYYDGERTFYQIASYTGDSNWINSAEYSEGVYRPYVLNNNGTVPGYRNFAKGMVLDFYHEPVGSQERTNDVAGVTDLFNNCGPYPAGMPDVAESRETAYAINSGVQALRLGVTINQAKLQEYVDVALGHIDQWVVTKKIDTDGNIIEPFMLGLTSEALIGWYNWTVDQHAINPSNPVDTRIAPAIKAVADWLIGQTGGQYNAWDPAYGSFDYMIHYAGQTVDINQATAVDINEYTNQLNNLIVPMFGWLYSKYGETNGAIYRQWGDAIFADAVTCSIDTGKQFSQNYRWSGDYVQWRLNNAWALDTTGPALSQYSEKSLSATGDYVKWTTDEAASSVVEYGLTASYGASLSNTLLMKNHRQEITGLTAGATYHYRIASTDSSGNVTYSPDRTFVAGANPVTVAIAATDRDAMENSIDTGTFTVTRSSGVGALTINYTISGLATNGVDYQTLGTSLSFADGETSKTITVTPLNDSQAEATETVVLTLAEDTGFNVTSPAATVRIFDDESPVASVSVSMPDAWGSEEGNNTATWRLTRTSSIGSLTVLYRLSGDTVNGVNYQMLGGSVTFNNGELTKDVVMVPIDDDKLQGNQTVTMTLVEDTGITYKLGTSTGNTYISTSDSIVSIAATDASANVSGSDPAVFTISRTYYDGMPITLHYTLSGTAVNGVDYQTLSGTLYMAGSESTKTITVNPLNDGVYAGNKGVTITLTAPAGCDYQVSASSVASATIIDNGPPTVSVGGPYAIGQGTALTLNASATDPDSDTLTYAWDINGDGTYTDASGASPTVTWAQLQALGLGTPGVYSNVRVRVDDAHGHVVPSGPAQLSVLWGGDANSDGKVSFQDYIVLEGNFGKTGMSFFQGDFNGDGAVTFQDYIVLEGNFNKSIIASAPAPLALAAPATLPLSSTVAAVGTAGASLAPASSTDVQRFVYGPTPATAHATRAAALPQAWREISAKSWALDLIMGKLS